MKGLTISASLREATEILDSHSDSPRLDAELLLGKVLELSRAALVMRGTDAVAPPRQLDYQQLLARRVRGEPIAYLTGTREFWSLELDVTPDVLVPRPETELLVELALERLPKDQARSVLDLGTGSGAIALAIASERPRVRMIAVDASEKALAVAAANSRKLGLPHIEWRLGSWFDALPDARVDLIASNPPYVEAGDPALERLAAEPLQALVAGPTGLDALTAIIERATAHLHPGGWLLLEHGHTQGPAVAALLQRHGFGGIHLQVDYSGKPRVTLGARPTHGRRPESAPHRADVGHDSLNVHPPRDI
jgi:release factor glutamine methyltransferase